MVAPHVRIDIARTLTSWPFLASLTVLVLNDLYLKFAFSNWLTGKLSDFSGLFFVSLLMCAICPRSKFSALAGLAVGFCLWKSPLSEPFIAAVRNLGLVSFGRVVDYTDLIALSVLPAAAYVTGSNSRKIICIEALRRCAAVPILLVTALAVGGSLSETHYYNFTIATTKSGRQFDTAVAATAISNVAAQLKLKCTQCEHPEESASFQDNFVEITYKIENRQKIRFEIIGRPRLFYFDHTETSIRIFKVHLMSALERKIKNLEYISRLPEKRYEPIN